jgi:tight adherence protein B
VTPFGWLLIGVALVAVAGPAPSMARLGMLTSAGRLRPMVSRRPRRPSIGWIPATGCAAVAIDAGVWALGGVLVGAATAVACTTGWFLAREMLDRRERARREAQLGSALRLLISELEAGGRPAAALAAAAGVGPAFGALFNAAAEAASSSGSAASVLRADPDTRQLGVAWQLAEETGIELAGVLARVGHDLAAAEVQRRAVAVVLAGPRASAVLLALLPMLGLMLGAGMGARPWEFLLRAPPGRAVCCAGVLLDVAGVLWMQRMLRRAQRP